MPTEIQYGVEAGGREWALSRGGKHSNNTMKTRRRWRAKERGGGCQDLRQEMVSNGFPAPPFLSIPHLPSMSLSVCFHYFSSFFSSFSLHFLTDALLTGVVLRLGSAGRLTPLLRRSRGSNQAQCVCACVSVEVCAGVCFLKKPPSVHLSLFHTFSLPFPRSPKRLPKL